MNRTKIIEHYKKFMQLDKMQEDYQIDIDWMQAFIEDYNLVNKNDLLPVVMHRFPDNLEIWKWWKEQKFQKEQGEQEYTMIYEIDLPKILKAFAEHLLNGA